jgi:hypothetical protein
MLPMDATVSAVVDPDSRWWNVPLIYSMFSKEEADCITVIHLSKYGQPDLQIWRGTSTGEFKVRSAYYLEKDSKEVDQGKSSHNSNSYSLWKTIWGMHVPNPVKMFLWRSCHNILPTKDNLQKKGIVLDSSCIFCNYEQETAQHVLWDCPSASDVSGDCDCKIQ